MKSILPISCQMGLHQLRASVDQLGYMTQHTECLLKVINVVLERTYAMAPRRMKSYELGRRERKNPHKSERERLLEKAIWKQWAWEQFSVHQNGFSAETCQHIQTFQMPLRGNRGDKSWGMVDLVGVSFSSSPVVLELKQEAAKDTPLRMLVEGLAYAVAVRRAWNEGNLREEWLKSVKPKPQPVGIPETLLTVPIIGIAPTEYWKRKIGIIGQRSGGKVPESAWLPFKKLCQTCADRGFPVSFLEFTIGESDASGLPSVHSIRPPQLPW